MQENPPHKISPVFRLILQALFVFFSGIFIFLVLGLSAILVDQTWYAGRVLPGIAMDGIDLSGMELNQAQAALSSQIELSQTDVLTLQYGDQIWQVSPKQLGLDLDATASARAAFEFGRQGFSGQHRRLSNLGPLLWAQSAACGHF